MVAASGAPHVAVFVTRGDEKAFEILVKDVGGRPEPLGGALLAGEHPTEGACRVAALESGYDVYFTFRKLGETTRDGALWHLYQTSPEVELPDVFSGATPAGRLSWLKEAQASRISRDFAAGMQRLLEHRE